MGKIVAAVVVLSLLSCRKNDPQEYVREKATPKKEVANPNSFKILLDPDEKEAHSVGEVELDGDDIRVIERYTDKIAFVQPTIDVDGNKGSYMYRDMEVLLVRKKNADTIILKKKDFIPYITSDTASYIMQSAATKLGFSNRTVPLYVSLCKPDTDVCFEFSVRLKDGRPVIEEIFPEEED